MLFDPFEEQFDLPAALVERADGRGRQPELVGEEHQSSSRFSVLEADAPQVFRVMLAGVVTIQGNGLIADDTGGTVCRGRIDPMGIHVRFGAGDEEGSGEMQHMEAGEIDITPIHNVDGSRLREQKIERVNVVQLAIRNVDEARDVAAQVQQRVHLDRRPLVSPNHSPQMPLETVVSKVHHGGHREKNLRQRRAPFETAAPRPPQGEDMRIFLNAMLSKAYLMLRSAHGARLEARTASMQPFDLPVLRCAEVSSRRDCPIQTYG